MDAHVELASGHSVNMGEVLAHHLQPPLSCHFIKDLFGPQTPAVPVFGSLAALDILSATTINEGLYIQCQAPRTLDDLVSTAYHHLQRAQDFPTNTDIEFLRMRTSINGWSFGTDPEDIRTSAAHSVAHLGAPCFKELNVDAVLRFMRVVGEYYGDIPVIGKQWPRALTYELGIVTMTMEDTKPRYHVQVFQSRPGERATHRIFLFRWCVGNPTAVGEYDEYWRAFSDGRAPQSQAPQQLHTTPLLPASRVEKRRLPADTDDEDGGEWADDEASPSPGSDRTTSRSAKKPRKAVDFRTLTFDQILTGEAGNIGPSAKLIAGEIILHIAGKHTNKDIFDKINATLEANGHDKILAANNITKRITLALQQRSRRKGKSMSELRKELNEARKNDGVRGYGGARVNEPKVQGDGPKNRVNEPWVLAGTDWTRPSTHSVGGVENGDVVMGSMIEHAT